MLHVGLDLSRKRLDVCLINEGRRAGRSARRTARRRWAAQAGGHGLGMWGSPRAWGDRVDDRRAVCSRRLEELGWDVEIADAQKVKGLAPLACKTDKLAWTAAHPER